MELEDLISVLRTRWKIVTATFLVVMALCGAYLVHTKPAYASTAKVFLTMDVTHTDIYSSAFYLTQQAPSYASLVTSAKMAKRLEDRLNAPDGLPAALSASVDSGTEVISVTATSTDPAAARDVAEAAAQELTVYLQELQKTVHGTITTDAPYPVAPIAPAKTLDLIVAALTGLLLGIGLAFTRDRLDKTIRTDKQVETATGGAVLAKVIHDPQTANKPLLTDIGDFASRAEAFRLLRTNLQFVDLDHPPRVFVVTSSVPAEGKTQTATNLAISMAKAGHRTLLVDGDLRRPTAAGLLGLDSSVGLTTVLTGQIDLSKAIQVHPESGLHLLAAGKRPPNPTEVLQTQATRDLIGTLREAYDAVIIDAPPLLPVADPAVLASAADGAIVVTRHRSTTVQQLELAASRLHSVGGRIFGTVVNMVPRPDPGAYAYYMEYAPIGAKPQPVRRLGRFAKKATVSPPPAT